MKGLASRCPHCRRPSAAPWKPVRVCSRCSRMIGGGDKWCFGKDGRVQHRHCDNPSDYWPPKQRIEWCLSRGLNPYAWPYNVLRGQP